MRSDARIRHKAGFLAHMRIRGTRDHGFIGEPILVTRCAQFTERKRVRPKWRAREEAAGGITSQSEVCRAGPTKSPPLDETRFSGWPTCVGETKLGAEQRRYLDTGLQSNACSTS